MEKTDGINPPRLRIYSERLLYAAIWQEVIAGSREVLFQAATNKPQTFLYGTQAS